MNKQVFLALKKDGAGRPSIVNAACSIEANQFDKTGEASFAFDELNSKLAAGTYELELKIVEPDGRVWFYPDAGRPFFTAMVCDSLG